MKFENRDYTIGELYSPAMEITDQKEADEYFKALVEHHTKRYGQTVQEATSIQKQNLGYFSGYYDTKTMQRVQKLFSCQHPIFGSIVPTADEAFKMGQEFAESKK